MGPVAFLALIEAGGTPNLNRIVCACAMPSKRGAAIIAVLAAAVVGTSMLFTHPASPYRVVPSSADTSDPLRTTSIASRVFLLLKTGVEVAYDRLPAHVGTTLEHFPTSRVYADANYTISGIQMVDCLALLDEETLNSEELLGYRLRRLSESHDWNWGNKDILIGKDKSGWKLDRFKNMPAFAHAWSQDTTKDWYVMIDADSYLFVQTLEFVTLEHDPDDIVYLGRGIGGEPFAHGGSGIVLSRGAMKAFFGTTEKEMASRLTEANKMAMDNCCGDEVVAQFFIKFTGMPSGTNLEHTDFEQFQGRGVSTVFIPIGDEQWCNPAPVFHSLKGWEVYRLDKWERDCDAAGLNLTYGQYYHDFVMPHAVPELSNWVIPDGPWLVERMTVHNDTTREAHQKELCTRECVDTPDCMMWTYLGGESCKIFHNVVSPGERMDAHNPGWADWPEVASGYMVDRIKSFRKTQPCEVNSHDGTDEDREEGWLIEHLIASGESDLEGLHLESHAMYHENDRESQETTKSGADN